MCSALFRARSHGICALVFVVASPLPLFAARHRTVEHPLAQRASIRDLAVRVAESARIDQFQPRLHWENAPFLDGLVLLGEELNREQPGSGDALIERAAAVILESDDDVESVSWGDGTAFSQVAMDLVRVLPAGDARRSQLVALLAGPTEFARHAIRDRPDETSPRDPWWIAGGYGTRYWEDDVYMVIPWLAMAGSSREGLPADPLARDLAYEWIEAYVYDHRPSSSDPRVVAVPTNPSRNGLLLFDDQSGLFFHAPEDRGADRFWGRGNAWVAVGLLRSAEALDSPYGGSQYVEVVDAPAIRGLLKGMASSLVARRTPDGGWGASLSDPAFCPSAETSATGLLTFFLARGINEGWLDRETYAPVVMRAFGVLLGRIAPDGSVSGIQPPGIGPACDVVTSVNADVNYGVGAVILAISEVLRLTDQQSFRKTNGVARTER